MNNKIMFAVIVQPSRIADFTTLTIAKIKHMRTIGADITVMVDSFDYPKIKLLLIDNGEHDVPVKVIMGNPLADESSVVQLLCTTTTNQKYTSLYATEIDFLMSIDTTSATLDALNTDANDKIVFVKGSDTLLAGGSTVALRSAFGKPHDKKLFKLYKPRSKKKNTVYEYLSLISGSDNDK